MKTAKNKELEINPEMPVPLKAKLENSSAIDQFRVAADHYLIYMTLVNNAWKDIQPVVDWYIEQKRYQAGIQWLYDNTPDVVPRVLSINIILDAEKDDLRFGSP